MELSIQHKPQNFYLSKEDNLPEESQLPQNSTWAGTS
jgi:hypothetical protein